jgi:hypothetical protein
MASNGTLGPRELKQTGIDCTAGSLVFQANKYIEVQELKSATGVDLSINSGLNADIVIDALGTGKLLLNTLHPQSVIFGINSTSIGDAVYFAPDGDLTKSSLGIGSYLVGGEYHPYILATIPGVGQQNLRIGAGGSKSVVINDIGTSDISFTHSLEVNGSIGINGSGSFYMNGALVIQANADIFGQNLTLTGSTYPKETGGYLGLSVALPSALTGIYVALPPSTTTIAQFVCVVNLVGGNGTAIIEILNSSNVLIGSATIPSNGLQLSPVITSMTASGYVQIRIVAGTASTGVLTIASYFFS